MKYLILLLFSIQATTTYCQKFQVNKYQCTYELPEKKYDLNWKCLGPSGQPKGRGSHIGNGQMNRLRLDPRFHNVEAGQVGYGRIYACSPSGGLWRTEDEAENWQCITSAEHQLPANNISDVAVSHQRPSRLFIATGDGDHSFRRTFDSYNGRMMNSVATSGVWRSTDDGENWERLTGKSDFFCDFSFDSDVSLNVILVNPTNDNELFVLSSKGVLRCQNANAAADQIAWEHVLSTNDSFGYGEGWRGLAFAPDEPSTIYASGKNIYVSKDGGNTWNTMSNSGSGYDLDSMYNEMIDDGFCNNRKIHYCPELHDSLCGESTLTQRLYKPRIINVATTPAAPDRVYALVLASEFIRQPTVYENQEDVDQRCRKYGRKQLKLTLELYIFMKTEGEAERKWQRAYRTQSWGLDHTRMSLQVSPTDSNLIYFGFVPLVGSSPGLTDEQLLDGNQFSRKSSIGSNGIHVDIHALAFEPEKGGDLYVGHDGGISLVSPNAARRIPMQFKNNKLQTNLIFTFDHSEINNPNAMAVIGTQDCGSMVYRKNRQSGEMEWHSLFGGDGYGIQMDDISQQIYLLVNNSLISYDPKSGQNTTETRYRKDTGNKKDMRPYDGVNHWEKAILPATFKIINNPDTDVMTWGFTEIYERAAVTMPDSAKENPNAFWKVLTDGGKRLRDQWRRRLTEFDICESNPDYIYYAYSGEPIYDVFPRLYRTTNGGCKDRSQFADFDNLHCVEEIPMDTFYRKGPFDRGFVKVTDVCAHPTNPNKVYLTFAGYIPECKVWSWEYNPETSTGVWKDESSESLNNLAVNAIAYQKGTSDRLYIGTDAGMYFKDSEMDGWQKLPGFPNVRCTEIKPHYCSGKLRVATFGRGLWEGDLLPYNSLESNSERVIKNKTAWNQHRALTRNLRIEKGGHLILKDSLSMPRHGRIFVERGGKLTISNGADVYNACNEDWKGIELQNRGNIFQRLFCKKAEVVYEN